MYLIEAHYQDDAERRRIEYLVRKYKEQVEKASGFLIFIKDDSVIDEFLNELRSKLLEDNISVYQLEDTDLDGVPETRGILMKFDLKPHFVNAFLGYFIEKRQGELMKQLPGYHRWYRIMTRKGKVDLEVLILEKKKTVLTVNLSGFEPALSIIADELESDLNHFKAAGGSK